jgi:hypothetical protein
MKNDTILISPCSAGQPSYTYNTGGGGGAVGAGGIGGYGIDTITITGGEDTITLDPLIYTGGSSMSSPSTFSWNQDYTTWSTAANHNNVNISSSGIDMQPGTDIKIAGKSLSDAIEKIEARLGILNPNPELEDRWDQLKDLRKQYMEMEKDLLEKEKIMKILKEK